MSEMQIVEPAKTKDVIDYDFILTSGMRLPITLEPDNGDIASDLSDRYILDITSKESPIDPEIKTNAEIITVFKSQIMAVAVRYRKQPLPTQEEIFEMRKTLHALSDTIQ